MNKMQKLGLMIQLKTKKNTNHLEGMLFLSALFFLVLPLYASAANYPLMIIQPQPNLDINSRFYRAYPGIEYRVPIGAFGGAYPFTYSLTTAPAGMIIDQDTGIITWQNPTTTGSPHPVAVRVTDAEGSSATRSWTITVTTAGFVFIDAANGVHAQGFGCTSNCGTGAIGNPFRSMNDVYQYNPAVPESWRNTLFDNYFIYWREGTYGLEGMIENFGSSDPNSIQQANLEWRGNYKPHVWLAYPGETVTIDHNLLTGSVHPSLPAGSNGVYLDWRDGVSTDAYIQGITFRDMLNHAFRINGDRIVFFENSFINLGPGMDGANSAFIMYTTSGSPGTSEYNLVKDCVFDTASTTSYIKTYSLGYSIFDGNTFSNPFGSTEGLALKALDRYIDVRKNTFIGSITAGSIGGNWHDSGNFEIRYNKILDGPDIFPANWNAALSINQDSLVFFPVYIHHNTIEGTVLLRQGSTGQGPFYLNNNVIVNSQSGTPAGSHVSHLSSVTDPSVAVLGTGASANLVGYSSDNIIDANGDLTTAYSSYLGTHGYQITASNQPAFIEQNTCNDNSVCAWPESCNTCPSDCGSCNISSYTQQRPKFIDKNCQYNGNGLVDSCAQASGGAGRFNELQSAIDSLRAGDTLYIYPGDYWRQWAAPGEYVGVYTIRGINSGTADQPVIITAKYLNNHPTINSFDPTGTSTWSLPALSTHGEEDVHNVIFDHLNIRGRAKLSGRNNTMQYLDCTFGWGACGDGNWACLRMDNCADCVAHHNFVHDISGAGACQACQPGASCLTSPDPFPDRGSGMKEFSSANAIWEYNTVRNTPRWGYDLHRNSVNPVVRFNVFEQTGSTAIHIDRSTNNYIYGNIMLTTTGCVDAAMLNEDEPVPHTNSFHHNTCAFAEWAMTTDATIPSQIFANANYRITQGGNGIRNINAPGANHIIDYNAYDSNANYHTEPWNDATRYTSLSQWQSVTGHDTHSQEASGGFCTFVNPPSSVNDIDYDFQVTGSCTTLFKGSDTGPYGITDCVGYLCDNEINPPALDTTPPSQVTGLTAIAVSQTQINLTWNASTDDIGVAGYSIYRNSMNIANTTSTSYQNTGLTANTTYNYYIRSYDAAGNIGQQSQSASATTHSQNQAPIPGDVDGNRVVNLADLQLVVNTFGRSAGQAGYNAAADLAAPIGTINLFDVMVVVRNWGQTG